jgi:hypothetical protein
MFAANAPQKKRLAIYAFGHALTHSGVSLKSHKNSWVTPPFLRRPLLSVSPVKRLAFPNAINLSRESNGINGI